VSNPTEPRPDDQITRARLVAIVDSSDDAIISKTLDGIITSWNTAAERMFGYTAAEALGQSITLLIPDDRLDEEKDVLTSIRRGDHVRHFETVRRAKDGRLLDISLTVSPVKDASGRIIGVSKISRDITERRRTEKQLTTTIKTLEALYRLADSVGRAKDLASVCEAGIDAIMAVGASRASVLTFDEAGVMRFRAWRNLSDAYRAAVDGHSPWSPDIPDPQPIVVEDVRADPAIGALRDVIAAEGIRSLAFIPLVNHGRLLGKFMIYFDAAHGFAPAELRLAASIAQHLAFGLDRVLAEAAMDDLLTREQTARREADAARVEAEKRRAVAEELVRLAAVMNESLDVAAVGERVVESARVLLRARASALRLAAADGSLIGIAFRGPMKDVFVAGHAIPAGPADDAAVLAAPLRNKGRTLGVLSVADPLGRRFSVADAEMLQACADQAALAIENARLYEEARRQQREAEVVADVAQRVNESLDLQTTLEHLVEGARELCGGDIGRIVVRDPDSGLMRLRHQVGTRWDGYHDQMTIEPGRGSGGLVLVTGKPFRTENYAEDPRITGHYMVARTVDGTIAQIVVPIPGDPGIAGLLYVDRRERWPFTDGDEAILLRLAGHAGTAIRNSQLFAAERVARAEADAANRGKDQFLAVLSHELRTPLNAILGWARMLRAAHLDERQRVHAIEVIERNADLQTELIEDLLDISRIAVGKMEIEREPVDLVLVARQALEGVTAGLDARKLSLVVDLDETAGEVLGEARRLQQVVSNLLLNAIKFTPEGGRVELRLVRYETNARLIVTDTGQGVETTMLRRIFDPFEQADSSTTRMHQGLGLGLAIVRQLVELHGGTIRAESEGKGKGATFTVDLPVLAVRLGRRGAGVDAKREGIAPGTSLTGCRVLIVDDQPDARELVALVLARAGAAVHLAASAGEALQALGAHEIDVLVSDLAMPETDGYALIQQVRAVSGVGRTIRAVAVTAHIGRDVRDRALAAGFDACATKPLNAEDLIELLERLRD
jgi:PAS domain S-box-containing protein